MTLPAAAEFLPYRAARNEPNIVVDGAPLPSTTLTLSHWPNNQSPPGIQRDTSTETAFAYLDTPALHQATRPVTTNHFDEDGLFSMFALTSPEFANQHRQLLVDASYAGDFGVVRNDPAAQLCFAIEALTTDRAGLVPADATGAERVVALYRAMLGELPKLIRTLPAQRDLWRDQFDHFLQSRAALANGLAQIREIPDLDLAVVSIDVGLPRRATRRYLTDGLAPVHPFAINTATGCSRVLRIHGQCFEFEYRYESWVRLATRRVPLRVSLDALAAALNARDGDAAWTAEPPSEIAPRLHRRDGSDSSVPAEMLLSLLADALRTAPVAWDPYHWQGGQS